MADELLSINPLKLSIRQMRKVEEATGSSYRNIDWTDVSLDLLTALVWAIKSEADPAYTLEDAEGEEVGPLLEAMYRTPEEPPADPTPPPSGSGGG